MFDGDTNVAVVSSILRMMLGHNNLAGSTVSKERSETKGGRYAGDIHIT